jgi:hypothetical protein
MTFLKKIFGKKKRQFVVREPRVTLNENHRISFIVLSPSERSIKLANISSNGLGAYRSDFGPIANVKEGDEIKGRLHVDQEVFDVTARIRHVTAQMIGCMLASNGPDLKRAIENYLRLEILGLRLNQVDEAYLKPDPDGQVTWYTDGRHNEVYCVRDSTGIVKFHLTFIGNYIEGGRGRPIVCGYVKDGAANEPGHKGSSLVEESSVPAPEMLNLARSLVQNIEKMPADLKVEIQAVLANLAR